MFDLPHGEDMGGAALYPLLQFAISKDSNNIEGAGEFVTTYIDYKNDEYTSMYFEISADDRSKLSKIKNISGFPCSWELANALFLIFDETHSIVTITEYDDGSAMYSISGIFFQNYVNELQDTFMCLTNLIANRNSF